VTSTPEQGRVTVTCPHCHLRQFRAAISNQCRRCGRSLIPDGLVLPLTRDRAQVDPVSRLVQIGGRIRHLRIRAGYTQAAFAEALVTDRTYISRIENTRTIPTLCTLVRMADALRLEPAKFFAALFA
jgi:DNA-binding XRE family transcriptional regulator